MINSIDSVVLAIADILYKPYIVPLLLIAGGIYFTCRTRFMQIGMFKEGCKVILEKPSNEEGISSFGALMVSTASRVGTGNIIGVCSAIIMGGEGDMKGTASMGWDRLLYVVHPFKTQCDFTLAAI